MSDLEGCPVCGSPVEEHSPPSATEYEHWKFGCDAEVIRYDNGKLSAEEPCYAALRFAVKRLNGDGVSVHEQSGIMK